jgi:hypothetical protein
MISRRCTAEMLDQRAISSNVRKQPVQIPREASTSQILMQGDSMGVGVGDMA